MATLVSYQNGSYTQANFATVDTATGAMALIRRSNPAFNGAGVSTSVTFTITNGAVIDGVLMWLATPLYPPSVADGTLLITLRKSGVVLASCMIDKCDLPPSPQYQTPQPCFFKFGNTVTGDGTSTYTLQVTTTGANGVWTYDNTSTAGDWTRALRTTNYVAPAAGDNIYIVGEMTGRGTRNFRDMIMNSTTPTVYGSGVVNQSTVMGGLFAVGAYATLTFGNQPNTNYVLRVNGDVWITSYGTLNVGAPSFPMPRSSTAVFEIQPVSNDQDFWFRFQDLCTVNTSGLSRSPGKDIVKCKLNANTPSPFVNARGGGVVVNGGATGNAGPDASGNTMFFAYYNDNATNGPHGVNWNGPTVTNTTQVFRISLTRGPGLNNRYIRITIGNNATFTSVTNGFYADIDLQLGTISAVTNLGNGVGISATIVRSSTTGTPWLGASYIITLTGNVSTASTQPYMHVMVGNAAGNVSYAGNTTICFYYVDPWIVTGTSIPDTTFSVDTDTGWLQYDAFALASTTRSGAECEIFSLSADAAASLLTVGQEPLLYAHSGASPTQAEVALITRNVKLRSSNPAIMVSMLVTHMATLNCAWTEFAYMGVGSGSRRGINIDSGPGPTYPKTFNYCCLHDFRAFGIYTDANTNYFNTNIYNTTFWNCSTPFQINNPLNYADWSVDNCLAIYNNGQGFVTVDDAGSITNCTAVGCTGNNQAGFYYSEGGGTMGRFFGNTCHSGYSYGVRISSGGHSVRIDNFTAWRTTSVGVYNEGSFNTEMFLDNLVVFGCTNHGIMSEQTTSITITGNSVICGDSSFATVNGIFFNNGGGYNLNISNVDFLGGGSTIFVPPTNTFVSNFGLQHIKAVVNNCKFGGGTIHPAASRANWHRHSYFKYQRYNQVANDHRTVMKYGTITLDPVVYGNATPSTRVTPTSAISKMESAPPQDGLLVQVNSATRRLISARVRKSTAADGAAYNGNQPRLIQRANAALGQPYDVVLGTSTLDNGLWDSMTALTSLPTDNGAFEYVIDGDGTTGFFNVDDFGIKVADPTVLSVFPSVIVDPDSIKATVPSPFNPLTDITGVVGWYDASVLGSMTLSGSTITAVVDQSASPSGKTLGVGTASINRPTYNPTGFFGQPAMMFSAAFGQMLEVAAFPLGTGTSLTLWAVGYMSSNANGAARWISYTSTGQAHDYQNDASFDMERNSTNDRVQLTRNGTNPFSPNFGYSIPVRLIVTISSAGVITIYANGVAGTPSTRNVALGATGFLCIGNGKFESNYLDGALAEFGLATGFCDAVLVAKFDTFLKAKWKFDGLGAVLLSETETFPVTSVVQPGFIFPNMINDMLLETLPPPEVAYPFLPTNFNSLVGWWDMSVSGSITYSTGVNIETVADQSGNGKTMTWIQTRPTYNATGLSGVKPAIVFDVASATAIQNASFPMGTGNTLTAWFVGTMPGSSVQSFGRALSYSKPSSADYDNTGSWCITSVGTSTSQIQFTHNNLSVAATGLAVIPAIHRVIYTVNADGTNTLYVDGINCGSLAAPAVWVTNGILSLGRAGGAGNYYTGNMGEWGVALDDSNPARVAKLDGYLKAKWNLPLDTLSAAPTGAWSPSRKLKSSFNSTTYYAATTGSVDTLYDQSGAGLNLTAVTTERPTIATAGPNSITCLSCDGNDSMTHGNNMTSLYSVDTGYMIASVRPTAWVNNNTTYWQTSRILGDSGGNSGMYMAGTGTVGRYYAGIYGGTTQLETAIATDTVYVVEWRHQNGFLYSRVNGGIEQAVAYGTGMSMGSIASCQIIGQIFEMAAFATPPTLAERDALVKAFGTYVGAAV